MGLVVGGENRAPGNSWGSRVVPPGNDGNVKESNGTETRSKREESPRTERRGLRMRKIVKGEDQEEREGRRRRKRIKAEDE
jgi:hypothetical protein